MSNFIVSARKYRPVRFDEVVGQAHVSQTLKNALQNDQLAHAFLFCGPRGVGKTTCARILAKVLNCQNRTSDFEACNTCSSCESFNGNASFNITELDAASNNSVEHIRALIEQVRFQPQQGQYKVFIIDEVHMLSSQAFNAFLKTLEEPPPYAVFILATTEKHKIIPTILSRCQIFDFRRIQVADMVAHLQGICQQENIEAEADALHVIAQKADGALRDALSIYDRIVSGLAPSDKKQVLTYKTVIDSLNVLDYDYFFRVVDALLTEDAPGVMMLFDEVQRNGFEADTFLLGLAEHARNLLVCKDPQTLPLLTFGEDLQQRFQQQAALTPQSFLLTLLQMANDCDVHYKMARNKQLHVEMTLLRMAYINRAIQVSQQPVTAPEQKSANLSAATKEPTATLPLTAPEKTYEQPPADQNPTTTKVEEPRQPPTTNNGKTIEKEIPPKKLTEDLRVNSKHNLPKLSSLADLDKEVDTEQPVETTPLTLEALQKTWKDYTAQIESPTTKLTFERCQLAVEEQLILVTVGSGMSKSMIQEESKLMTFLRKHLNNDQLTLQVSIDPSLAPAQTQNNGPKKAFSTREKYEAMKQINPLVEELRTRFDLRPDNE